MLTSITGASEPQPHRVLVLYSHDRLLPAGIKIDTGFRTELAKRPDLGAEVYSEYLDIARFPGPERAAALETYLSQRYTGIPPQVVVAAGDAAQQFFLKRRATLFPDCPLVLIGTKPQAMERLRQDPKIGGVTQTLRIGPTIDAMLRLRPGLRRIVFISGDSEYDRVWDSAVAEEQARLAGRVEFVHWARRPLADVLKEVCALPADTAIFYLGYLRDPNGTAMTAADAGRRIAEAASVPVFGIYETYVGTGIVGGSVSDLTAYGVSAARIVEDILANPSAATVGVLPPPPSYLRFDARQLDRWKISRRLLPPGAQLSFAGDGLFEQHPRIVTAIIAAIALQSVLITWLLIHRRQRQRVESALRMSEERYRKVVETQTEMVCRYLPDCTLTFVNEAYCRYFGLRAEELLGKSFLRLIPEESHPIVLETTRWIIAQKRPRSGEHEIIRPDGSVGWMRWEDYPIFDQSGELQELQGIGRDITEQHKAQAELLSSEEKFAAAFHGSPNAVCINRVADDRIVDVNERWEDLFQIRRSDALNRTHGELGLCVSEEDHARIRQAAEGRIPLRHYEMKMGRADGSTCWVSASCDLIRVGGEPCYLGIIQDITERKQAEEAQQNLAHASRLALIGELTASIAHEINQPLGAILSNAEAAEMMLSQAEPPLDQVRAILSDIRKDDLRASEVIKGVRALVSKRSGESQPLDLRVIVTDVLALLRPDAERRGVKLVSTIVAPTPRLHGNRVQLEQVLLNLFLNGMEAMAGTPPEKRRIEVQATNDHSRHIEISVKDAGHGIPPDEIPRIFDSFFTTKEHGMGLGLAMVRSIIELHGGHISAENNPDGGATFRFQLPLDKVPETEP